MPKFSTAGERLFGLHCASCHFKDQDMTCPALKGARQRWINNSSEDNFYTFIQNPRDFISTGDQYANQLLREWKIYMNPQQLSKEQIDEIFIYVEN
ncbi:c-type cytochrome [Crocinitomix catalasitica]|nr:c-type cytochrome [Crocinitomix catalasitica]